MTLSKTHIEYINEHVKYSECKKFNLSLILNSNEKLKESFKAVSVDTGYDSTFQTKQAMQKAIKSGSHAAIGSPQANKVQKKPKFGIDPEKMKAIAAKAAAKAKKKAKVKPKKDLSSTGGYTPPGETWKKDREPNISEYF